MSYAVFPSTSYANWDYQWPIKRTPSFRTLQQMPTNNIGRVGISTTPFNLWKWSLDLSFIKGNPNTAGGDSAFQTVVGFYGSQLGAAGAWLYEDPYDYGTDSSGDLISNSIGTGDGSTTIYQTTRSMGGLIDLIQNFQSGYPNIYVAGTEQPTDSYTLDEFGTLTFNTAPGSGDAITWEGNFYWLCYFTNDTLGTLQNELFSIWSCDTLEFEEWLL